MKKTKIALIVSTVFNVLLLLYIVGTLVTEALITDYAVYQGIKHQLCEVEYQNILNDYDTRMTDPAVAHSYKNNFAINVCLRNYKTGEPLNLQPLVDQVQ